LCTMCPILKGHRSKQKRESGQAAFPFWQLMMYQVFIRLRHLALTSSEGKANRA